MTLKEKLNEQLSEAFANEIEQIADEFAIGFAEWTHNLRDCEEDSIEFNQYINISSEELLEMYKKEKGL